MKEPNNHIELLISLEITGEISAQQTDELESWMAESTANRMYLEESRRLYELAEKMPSPDIDVDREWVEFSNNNLAIPEQEKQNYSWLRVAASIVIIAVLGYLFLGEGLFDKNITIVAESTTREVVLPDSTVVTLNAHSTITYPKEFSDKMRIVNMKGEAFFEVTRNPVKPFIVNLDQSKVEVLGTTFNINTMGGADMIEVVVNSGHVRFSSLATNESVELSKGEKGIMMKTSQVISKHENQDINFMAWKTRRIVFNDVALDEVIKTLNHIYQSDITFSTTIQHNCNVTVSFDNQSIEAVLRVLKATLGIEYTKAGNDIIITKTGC